MAAKSSKKKFHASNRTDGEVADPNLLRALASAMASAQGSKLHILKPLYYLLVHSSLRELKHWGSSGGALQHLNIESSENEVESNCEDLRCLFDVLFMELDMRFNEYFHAFCKHGDEPPILFTDMQATVEEVALLLRCCMTMMTLLESCQDLVAEKGHSLFSILTRLVSCESTVGNENGSFVFQRSVSHEYISNDDGHATAVAENVVSSINFLKPPDPSRTFLCTMLEVFADELLMNKLVRELFLAIDLSSASTQALIMRGLCLSDSRIVLEVISAHFVLSFPDENAIKMFLGRLFWQQENEIRSIQISLNAALSLLLNPVMFSAPKIFQTYLILLVSDAIGIRSSPYCMGLDVKLINRYLAVFERSVILYTRHMCHLGKVGNQAKENALFGKFVLLESKSQVDFERLLSLSTWEKVNHLITKISDSWVSHLSSMSTKEDAELLAFSVSYAKEVLHVFDGPSEEIISEILSILGCIIIRACSDEATDTILQKYGEGSSEDLYLLASMLKLLSCSMLKVICCLKSDRNLGSSKATGDVSGSKEYDALILIVECFQQLSISLPVQSMLWDTMKSYPQRHRKSKWMLLHFAGLLSLSYVNKLDFLMKNTIFAILTLLHLFIYEEGDLEVLRPLVGPRSKSTSSVSSNGCEELTASCISREAAVNRKSSHAVALKFQKIRTLYLGKLSQTGDSENGSGLQNMDSAVGVEEGTCNGETFLRCMLEKGSCASSDIDDLADFIVCKSEKDYGDWLKGREMFRKRWKSEKFAICRGNKKKKAWRHSRGNRAKLLSLYS